MKRIKWNPPTTGCVLYLSGTNYLKGDVLEAEDAFEHPFAEVVASTESVFDLVEQTVDAELPKPKRKPRKTT